MVYLWYANLLGETVSGFIDIQCTISGTMDHKAHHTYGQTTMFAKWYGIGLAHQRLSVQTLGQIIEQVFFSFGNVPPYS